MPVLTEVELSLMMKKSIALRWFVSLILVATWAIWAATGHLPFLRLAYAVLFLLLVSGLWSLVLGRGIEVRREARLLRASVGDVFEERFEVSVTTWPGCPWVEVLNQSSLPGAAGSRLLTRIGRGEKRFYIARTLLTRRGAYPLGPTVVSTGDPFGLFPVEKRFPPAETLVVLPMTFPIAEFPPPAGLVAGGRAVHVRTTDVTPHATGIREYVPGDPMKRIHWPATARRGRFMVKEFEQDPQADIWLFLDARREVHVAGKDVALAGAGNEMFFWHRPKVALPCDTFEYALSAAASLAQHFLRDRRSVGLACSTARFTVLPAERGDRQLGKVMETLAFLEPDGVMSLLGLVAMQAKFLPPGTGVVLITPSTDPELLLVVEDLLRRYLRPVAVLLDAASFGVPAQDLSAIIDALASRSVPVCTLAYGDSLSTHLSLAAVYFQRSYGSMSYKFEK